MQENGRWRVKEPQCQTCMVVHVHAVACSAARAVSDISFETEGTFWGHFNEPTTNGPNEGPDELMAKGPYHLFN